MPVHLAKALEGLAENPALPTALARRLVAYQRGFGHVAMRADLTDELIAEILASDYRWLLHSLALNPHLPDAIRIQLTQSRDPSVRAALVIRAQGAARSVFERLIDDPDKTVRVHLAEGDHVPGDLRAGLARDPEPEVRAALARWWTQAPEDVRRILLTDPVDSVRAAACSTYYARLPHPVPPADLHAALLDDPITRAGVVRHLTLDLETARRLAEDRDYQVRRQVAEHPQLPAHLRDLLADDPSAIVRVGIFARPDTPEPIRERIYSEVRRGGRAVTDLLADQHLDDLDDLAILQEFEDSQAPTELEILHVAWVTADPLPHLDSPYSCFRASAARSPSLPPEAVARLLHDEANIVRTTAARHAPHLVDPATAERIDREFRPHQKVSGRPADDFTLPPETLRRLATDPDPRMRALAPRDPDLPAHLAERLATDADISVRRAIAPHQNLPIHVLISMLDDQAEWVVHAAAAAPALPVAEMERVLTLAGL
jgi:hypothetical protein